MKPWKLHLSKLTLDGPYSDYGGLKRLAEELGVLPDRLTVWMNGTSPPNRENQDKLRRLAEGVQ